MQSETGHLKDNLPAETGSEDFRGYLDSVSQSEIIGWAVRVLGDSFAPVNVGLFVQGGLITSCVANIYRESVKLAGIGDGYCGFSISLTDEMRDTISENGRKASIAILGLDGWELGILEIAETVGDLVTIDDSAMSMLRTCLFCDTVTFKREMERRASHGVAQNMAKPVAPKALFEPDIKGIVDPLQFGQRFLFPGYMEYAKQKSGLDSSLNTEDLVEDRVDFLKWYLSDHAKINKGLRVPLAKSAIDFLNEPFHFPNQKCAFSRALWWALPENPSLMERCQIESDEWNLSVLYWWAIHRSAQSSLEDCLVTARMAAQLQAVAPRWENSDFPLSAFMEIFLAESALFRFLDVSRVQDRRAFTMALMIMAVRRADYLRYLPEESVNRVLHARKGLASSFGVFMEMLLQNADTNDFSESTYNEIIRAAGFDRSRKCFTSITENGHRWHSAGRSLLMNDDAVDVQIIGPFGKSSGLGQSIRLVSRIVTAAGYNPNNVNFELGDPGRDGFSDPLDLQEYRRARINLIHMNAVEMPPVFAFEPGIFDLSYNVGFFYYELDTPAPCHSLALDLLDEVWVASDYGFQIYQSATDKPVINVGMSFEEVPEIDAKEARQFLSGRTGLNSEAFVFFTAFDSFSFLQRKNPVAVVKAFRQAFEGDDAVRLVIKTQNRSRVKFPNQLRIWAWIDAAIEADPRIVLIDETLAYEDFMKLIKGSDCYVSLHRSEGWGFGMIEAMNLNVPVVCTGYSGNMEFCTDETAWLVDYSKVDVGPDDYPMAQKGQQWAEPDLQDAVRQLQCVYQDATDRLKRTQAAYAHVKANFSVEAVAKKFGARLGKILTDLD
jgi:glycosyltransferase involved in cell wall biosynthesis